MVSSCQACEETPAPAAPSRRVNGWRVCLRTVESTRQLLAHLLVFIGDHHATSTHQSCWSGAGRFRPG